MTDTWARKDGYLWGINRLIYSLNKETWLPLDGPGIWDIMRVAHKQTSSWIKAAQRVSKLKRKQRRACFKQASWYTGTQLADWLNSGVHPSPSSHLSTQWVPKYHPLSSYQKTAWEGLLDHKHLQRKSRSCRESQEKAHQLLGRQLYWPKKSEKLTGCPFPKAYNVSLKGLLVKQHTGKQSQWKSMLCHCRSHQR